MKFFELFLRHKNQWLCQPCFFCVRKFNHSNKRPIYTGKMPWGHLGHLGIITNSKKCWRDKEKEALWSRLLLAPLPRFLTIDLTAKKHLLLR